MLFNSLVFIVGFLPVALAGFYLLSATRATRAAMAWLVAASLFFYGWWEYRNLAIIVPSVLGNYAVGWAIGKARGAGWLRAGWLIAALGVAGNLAAIAWFKYVNFLAGIVTDLTGVEFAVREVLLPLGISFFTFQQIKFLVDRWHGITAQPALLDYALLVSFFPHVIAGPIVNYDELLPQFRKPSFLAFQPDLFADGIAFFLLGLAKKVVLADQFGVYANEGFAAAAQGHALTLVAAWAAALGYMLQLYFDFSGYSDMAFGLARMVGLRFPQNFASPYKAVNIIEFWRRWHMTLSKFLRDYLYIPLGGNRHGQARRLLNIILTMLLGGLWHGAGWNFVFWGGLHGAYLVVNHLWQAARRVIGLPPGNGQGIGGWLSRGLTLVAVLVAWVFFRADNFAAATALLHGMAGGNGLVLPAQLIALIPALSHLAAGAGAVADVGGGTVLGLAETLILLALGYAIALGAPNLYEVSPRRRLALLVPSFAFTLQKVVFSAGASQFLYFRF
jgi:alginate O-acetyltransferase complex protein AlgI